MKYLFLACSRLLERRAKERARGRKREGTRPLLRTSLQEPGTGWLVSSFRTFTLVCVIQCACLRCRPKMNIAAKWVRMLRSFVIRARIDYGCSTSIAKFTPVTTIYFFGWIRYVMEEVRRNLSWKRQHYLFWFGLIPAKQKRTMEILKMPPFRRKIAHAWRACALILPLCLQSDLITKHAHTLDQATILFFF